VAQASPFLAMQDVERQVIGLQRTVDPDALTQDERKVMARLRALMVDVRMDIRDYELSETREEQLKKMTQAKKSLEKLEKSILTTSFVFGAADIAHLSAQLEYIDSRLV